MRLVPATAGGFRQGQVYVSVAYDGCVMTHSLDEFDRGRWRDSSDAVSISESGLVSDGWYLVDPGKEPATERDEFWEKCFLAALNGFCASDACSKDHPKSLALIAAEQADACVAERKARA